MNKSWIALMGLAVLLGGGLAAPLSAQRNLQQRAEWRGHLSLGFETSRFEPCGSKEAWWVAGGPSVQWHYQKLRPKMYERVYVRLRGTPSLPGKYGHLGMYRRQITVSAVLEARAARSTDCG